MIPTKIGLIAEEQNDVDVLYEFTCKLTAPNTFSFSKFIGHGCGKLRRKCTAWAQNLLRRGCSHLVVMHDLDACDEARLRTELNDAMRDVESDASLVLIPIYEVEAWLLCDADALKSTFKMKRKPRVPASPQRIRDPKAYLRDLIWKSCRKHYVNTIHNKKLASVTRMETLRACPSFDPYPQFITEIMGN
jgi:hypothetical protein